MFNMSVIKYLDFTCPEYESVSDSEFLAGEGCPLSRKYRYLDDRVATLERSLKGQTPHMLTISLQFQLYFHLVQGWRTILNLQSLSVAATLADAVGEGIERLHDDDEDDEDREKATK